MRSKILLGVCVALILSTAAEAQTNSSNPSPTPTLDKAIDITNRVNEAFHELVKAVPGGPAALDAGEKAGEIIMQKPPVTVPTVPKPVPPTPTK